MPVSQPTLAQLRPALQLALDSADPLSHPLPGRVRNLVRNRRLPANWALTMRQVIEEDDGFRAMVAASAEEDQLGRLAWLWLTRPEGWSAELDALVQAAVEADDQEKGLRRAEERIAELEAELAGVRADAGDSWSAQAALVADLDDRRRAVGSLEARLARAMTQLREKSAEAAAEADAARIRIDELQADNDRLVRELHHLRSRLSELSSARTAAENAAATAESRRSELADRYEALRDEDRLLRRSLGEAVAHAADAARQLAEAFSDASGALGAPSAHLRRPEDPPVANRFAGAVRRMRPDGPPARSPVRTGPAARRPLRLPPAVFDDSPEAAAHLVRSPGVHLIVDGYNVTFSSWTGDDLPGLRNRLVMALSELAVRMQRMVTVVFDGAGDGGRVPPPPVARPWLRIVFSASTVEADDLIVDAVRRLDPEVPVVVATDDRQVRGDVGRWGANVLSVEQLLGVLGRQPAGGR